MVTRLPDRLVDREGGRVVQVHYEICSEVAVVTLDDPRTLNALELPETLDTLEEHLSRVAADPGIRGLVLTGAGRAFCSGANMSTSEHALAKDDLVRWHGDRSDHRRFWDLTALSKPTVCAVNGAAVGAGAELAIMCDSRIGCERSSMGWVFVHRALVPGLGAGTYFLPRIIGLDRAMEVLLSGAIYPAEELLELGIIRELTQPGLLVDRAIEKVRTMSAGAPLATRWTKQLVLRGLERDVDSHLRATELAFQLCFQTDDVREGAQSFFERRAPQWSGE